MPKDLRRTEQLIRKRWAEDGYANLTAEERDYLVLWWLQTEVDAGGFGQYFFNSAGDSATEAQSALDRLNAASAQVLRQATGLLLAVGGYTSDRTARQVSLQSLPSNAFDAVTRKLQDREDDFVSEALAKAAVALSAIGFAAAVTKVPPAVCPFCSAPLRTARAKQCRACGKDWH